MTAFYDWNLILDEEGGPNHVKNYCDAPFLYNLETHKLEERTSYAYIGHFSKYITKGARRIGFSKYTQDIEVTAFENQDGSISVVFLNQTNKNIEIVLRLDGKISNLAIPEKAIATLYL